MQTRVLKSFLAVCRFGNLTRAAEAVHLSQPALSRQIQDLEHELGAELFDRSKRQITLTRAGMLLQLRAQEILDISARLSSEISTTRRQLAGIIRIGCVESTAEDYLIERIQAFRGRWPQALFSIYGADGDDIRRELDEGRLDIGLLLEPVETAKYETLGISATDRWGLGVKSGSLGDPGAPVPAEILRKMPLILPRRRIVLEEIASWAQCRVSELDVALYNNLSTIPFEFARRGWGALLCVEGFYVKRRTDGLSFHPLLPGRLVRHKLARRKNQTLSQAGEAFWDFLRQSREDAAGA